MRTICDVCESAPAILFCAADEAALCRSCDDKVHKCNKLASRHVRVGLADPSDVPLCDICENAPAFFYCEVDGSSLCLQCDTVVHVGGKQTHKRYLLLRQRVEFPVDKPSNGEETPLQTTDPVDRRKDQKMPKSLVKERLQNQRLTLDSEAIDLNARPQSGQPSANRARGMHAVMGRNNHQNGTVVPVGSVRNDPDK